MVFKDILSVEAMRLYERLLRGEHITIDDDAHNPEIEGSLGHELARKGLAAVSDRGNPRLFPVEASTAQAVLVHEIIRSIQSQHELLLGAIQGFDLLRTSARPGSLGDTEILDDPDKISHLSFEFFDLAQRDVSSFVTEHMEIPENQRTAMPRRTANNPAIRTLYTVEAARILGSEIEDSVSKGESARMIRSLPYKMIIVDGSKAMVAMDDTGLHAALLTSSQQLICGFRALFESLWERATPYPAGVRAEDLSPQERRVMSLLATGAKDEAIARQLDVTVRTVRRHITSAMDKLGADNRFAAGVQAVKRGWL